MNEKDIFLKIIKENHRTLKDVTILGIKKSSLERVTYTFFREGSEIKRLEISNTISAGRDSFFKNFMYINKIKSSEMSYFNNKYGIDLDEREDIKDLVYGVITIKKTFTNNFIQRIIGREIFMQALVSDNYIVKDAELLFNNKLIKVYYEGGESDFIFDKLPLSKSDRIDAGFAHKLSKILSPEKAYFISFNSRHHVMNRTDLLMDYMKHVRVDMQHSFMIRRISNESFSKLCLSRLRNNPRIQDYCLFKVDDMDYVYFKMNAIRYF